jgi:hypothetical protein
MCADHRQPPPTRQPGHRLALLLAMVVLVSFSHRAIAANKPTTAATAVPPSVPATVLKPPVQPAATGSLKTSRQALLKQRNSVIGPNTRHPGKIIGASTRPSKTIVTKRFLPK